MARCECVRVAAGRGSRHGQSPGFVAPAMSGLGDCGCHGGRCGGTEHVPQQSRRRENRLRWNITSRYLRRRTGEEGGRTGGKEGKKGGKAGRGKGGKSGLSRPDRNFCFSTSR